MGKLTAKANKNARAGSVIPGGDFAAQLREAMIALEAAAVAAEMLGMHHVVESSTFDRLVDLLNEAIETLAQTEADLSRSPSTIFPTRVVAERFIEQHPLDDGHTYRIKQDGAGRCSVEIYRLAGFV